MTVVNETPNDDVEKGLWSDDAALGTMLLNTGWTLETLVQPENSDAPANPLWQVLWAYQAHRIVDTMWDATPPDVQARLLTDWKSIALSEWSLPTRWSVGMAMTSWQLRRFPNDNKILDEILDVLANPHDHSDWNRSNALEGWRQCGGSLDRLMGPHAVRDGNGNTPVVRWWNQCDVHCLITMETWGVLRQEEDTSTQSVWLTTALTCWCQALSNRLNQRISIKDDRWKKEHEAWAQLVNDLIDHVAVPEGTDEPWQTTLQIIASTLAQTWSNDALRQEAKVSLQTWQVAIERKRLHQANVSWATPHPGCKKPMGVRL